MSLEDKIEALTAAVEANTAALLGGEAPAEKAPAKKAPAKAPAKKAPAKKPAAKKGPTADDIAKQFGEYLKTGDEDEREAAKANVKAIISHMETDRITNLDPEQYQDALDYLDAFKNGDDPFGDGEEEEEDDDGLM